MTRIAPLLLVLALAACSGGSSTRAVATSSVVLPPTSTVPSSDVPTTSSPSSSGEPSPAPQHVSGLVPPLFEDDVPSGDVPLAALIPLQTEVVGSWYLTTSVGEAIVVAWQAPTADPIQAPRGFVVWRRYADGGAPWRPIYSAEHTGERQVLGIEAVPGDVTGDGSDDVLVRGVSGATGNCIFATVVDIANAQGVFTRDGCDLTVDVSSDPVGLRIDEAVFRPGDAHCCPSARRITVLTYAGEGTWTRVSRTTTPA